MREGITVADEKEKWRLQWVLGCAESSDAAQERRKVGICIREANKLKNERTSTAARTEGLAVGPPKALAW
jgi:hypothetical protein